MISWLRAGRHIVCRNHLGSDIGHKQQAAIPFSNKSWRDRFQDPFSHPIEEFQAMARITLAISRVFPKPGTSGPVIMVVTEVMITSMVKMCCERMPMS